MQNIKKKIKNSKKNFFIINLEEDNFVSLDTKKVNILIKRYHLSKEIIINIVDNIYNYDDLNDLKENNILLIDKRILFSNDTNALAYVFNMWEMISIANSTYWGITDEEAFQSFSPIFKIADFDLRKEILAILKKDIYQYVRNNYSLGHVDNSQEELENNLNNFLSIKENMDKILLENKTAFSNELNLYFNNNNKNDNQDFDLILDYIINNSKN